MQLLLASSSRYRRDLLARLRLPFDIADPAVEETRRAEECAADLVIRLATAKAQALAHEYPNHLIIGSDQVAGFDDEILGKPGTSAIACEQLATLSGRQVRFSTGLCLLNTATGQARATIDLTEVSFRNLTTAEIAAYVDIEQPLDCAGSFKSEGLGVALFKTIETQDPSGLIGLPLIKLCSLLRAEGVDPLRGG